MQAAPAERRHLLIGHEAAQLDGVGDAELGGVGAQARLLGAAADDHDARARRLVALAPKERHRAQHVLMPFLPHQSPGGEDHRRVAARGAGRGGEARDIDARRADADPPGRSALEQQRGARALRRGEEEIGGRERLAAIGPRSHVAVGVDEGDRLPGREDEPEAETRLQRGRLHAVPVAELLAVDDVRPSQRGGQAEVAVPGEADREIAEPSRGQQVAQGQDAAALELEPGGVEPLPARAQVDDLEALAERRLGPGGELPGVCLVSAEDHDPRRHGRTISAPAAWNRLSAEVRIAIDARAAAEVPAGRGRYVRELLLGLARLDSDHDYRLVASSPWREGDLDERFSWELVGAPGLLWPLAAGRRMSQLADVALACTSYAVTAPWRIPGATIVYDFVAFDRRLHPPRGALLERLTLPIALRRCGALIAISETTRRELIERHPSAAARSSVAAAAAAATYTPQPGSDDEAILERHGLRRPYVLVAGTLEPRKNLPRVIEAYSRVEPRLREDWMLAIAGGAGWGYAEPSAALAQHGGLAAMLGFVPEGDLPCLYRNAELVCYLSLYEGFGLPVLEALQSGTAVLTSSVSSMPEVGGAAALTHGPTTSPTSRAR